MHYSKCPFCTVYIYCFTLTIWVPTWINKTKQNKHTFTYQRKEKPGLFLNQSPNTSYNIAPNLNQTCDCLFCYQENNCSFSLLSCPKNDQLLKSTVMIQENVYIKLMHKDVSYSFLRKWLVINPFISLNGLNLTHLVIFF